MVLNPVVVKTKREGDDVGEARDNSTGDRPRRAGSWSSATATVFDVKADRGRELPTLGSTS